MDSTTVYLENLLSHLGVIDEKNHIRSTILSYRI
jgi:hypothetical protein